MRSTSALLFATLALTAATATTAWAGSHGNAAAQWNAAYGNKPVHPQNQTTYSYCYGGNARVEYFSRVFPFVAATSYVGGGPSTQFGHFLTSRMGGPQSGQCSRAPTMAGATAAKQTLESRFQSAEFHHRQVVETGWAGH